MLDDISVVFGKSALLSACEEQAITLIIACDFIFRRRDAPLDSDLTRGSPFLALKVLLGSICYLVGALFPLLFGDSI